MWSAGQSCLFPLATALFLLITFCQNLHLEESSKVHASMVRPVLTSIEKKKHHLTSGHNVKPDFGRVLHCQIMVLVTHF